MRKNVVSTIADYFIIAGGSNTRQIQTIADNIEEKNIDFVLLDGVIKEYIPSGFPVHEHRRRKVLHLRFQQGVREG